MIHIFNFAKKVPLQRVKLFSLPNSGSRSSLHTNPMPKLLGNNCILFTYPIGVQLAYSFTISSEDQGGKCNACFAYYLDIYNIAYFYYLEIKKSFEVPFHLHESLLIILQRCSIFLIYVPLINIQNKYEIIKTISTYHNKS